MACFSSGLAFTSAESGGFLLFTLFTGSSSGAAFNSLETGRFLLLTLFNGSSFELAFNLVETGGFLLFTFFFAATDLFAGMDFSSLSLKLRQHGIGILADR